MNFRSFVLLILMGLPTMAGATAPTSSLRPELRPGTPLVSVERSQEEPLVEPTTNEIAETSPVVETPAVETSTVTPEATVVVSGLAVPISLLPTPRPVAAVVPKPEPEAEAEGPTVEASPGTAVLASLLPKKRPRVPKRFLQRISSREQTPEVRVSGGSVCGVKTIIGKPIKPIAGKIRGCGVANPVRITHVSGVKLSMPANVNCNTARALNTWVANSVKPTVGRLGGGVAGLKVVAHYSCRTRNNQPGAKISEHGRGNAVDIAAIQLKDGNSITVLNGWRTKNGGAILKKIHRDACGTFGTVLGPNSDRFHQDHFHFDVARHRGGAYCR